MSLSRMFKTSEELETKGTPVKYPADDNGNSPTFYLARMAPSNTKYAKALEAATRPYRRELQLGTMPESKATEIDVSVFVDAVLVGWEYVDMADVDPSQVVGQTETLYAPFTRENATKLMKRLPELLAELKMHARNMANFLESNLEAEAKN